MQPIIDMQASIDCHDRNIFFKDIKCFYLRELVILKMNNKTFPYHKRFFQAAVVARTFEVSVAVLLAMISKEFKEAFVNFHCSIFEVTLGIKFVSFSRDFNNILVESSIKRIEGYLCGSASQIQTSRCYHLEMESFVNNLQQKVSRVDWL